MGPPKIPPRRGPTLQEFIAALAKVRPPKGPAPLSPPGRPGALPRGTFTRQDTFKNDPTTRYGQTLLSLLLGGR